MVAPAVTSGCHKQGERQGAQPPEDSAPTPRSSHHALHAPKPQGQSKGRARRHCHHQARDPAPAALATATQLTTTDPTRVSAHDGSGRADPLEETRGEQARAAAEHEFSRLPVDSSSKHELARNSFCQKEEK